MRAAVPPAARLAGAPLITAPVLSLQLIPVRASLPELVRVAARAIGCPGADAPVQLSMRESAGLVRIPQVEFALVLTGALLMAPFALQVMVSAELLPVGI